MTLVIHVNVHVEEQSRNQVIPNVGCGHGKPFFFQVIHTNKLRGKL